MVPGAYKGRKTEFHFRSPAVIITLHSRRKMEILNGSESLSYTCETKTRVQHNTRSLRDLCEIFVRSLRDLSEIFARSSRVNFCEAAASTLRSAFLAA